MKKIILVVMCLVIISPLFAISAIDKEWIHWFHQRIWVMDDNSSLPVYESMNYYLGKMRVIHEQFEEDHYIRIEGDSYVMGSPVSIVIVYYVKNKPITMDLVYFQFGTEENASMIIYSSLMKAIENKYLE